MSSYLDAKYLDLYLRGFTSTIFALSGAVKASGALTEKMKPFGYPKYFPEALGLFEVILAVVNVGTEIGLGPQAATSNVWVQRIISVIMGGALYQHKLAEDGGYAVPAILLAFTAIVPGLRGEAGGLPVSVGTGAALGLAGWYICSLIAKKPKSKSK